MEKEPVTNASLEDEPEILRLYRSLIGSRGCTWDTSYPAREDIASDIASGSLFCIRDGGVIVAVASAGEEEQLLALSCWDSGLKAPCFLTRVAVAATHQRRGLARRLITHIEESAAQRGFDGICLLVSMENAAAAALYEACLYRVVGRARLFDVDWACREKSLTGRKGASADTGIKGEL